MRFTGNRELKQLYRDLEGIGYIPSLSYIALCKRIQSVGLYLSRLKADLTIKPDKIDISFHTSYDYFSLDITFIKQ